MTKFTISQSARIKMAAAALQGLLSGNIVNIKTEDIALTAVRLADETLTRLVMIPAPTYTEQNGEINFQK